MTRSRIKPLTRSIALDLHGSAGVALIELMLVLGVISIATTAIVATAYTVNSSRKVNDGMRVSSEIVENVNAAYASSGSFDATRLSQESALREGLFPKKTLALDGQPRTPWGGLILLASTPVGSKTDNGVMLTFEDVPTSACSKFVSAASGHFHSVSVDGTTVRSSYGPLNIATLASLCEQADRSRIQFVFEKNGGASSPTPVQSPCTAPAPTTQTVVDSACPAGQVGTRTYRTDHQCFSPYGPASDLVPVLIADTCSPVCVLPSPSTQTSTESQLATRVLACPSGELGATNQSQTQTRSATRTAVCVATPGYSQPTGPATWSAWSPWSAWTGTAPWTTTSNTCASACVAPPPSSATESNNALCPVGTLTPIGKPSFFQSATATTTYSCPSPTGPATSVKTYGPWSPAVATYCLPACSAPAPISAPTTRSAPPEQQTLSCTKDETGSIVQTRTRMEYGTATTTYSCPAPTGDPIASTSVAWLGTYTITGSWITQSNTCTPICGPAPPPSARFAGCAAGAYGSWMQSHGWTATAAPTCWTAGAWSPTIGPAGSCTPCPAPAIQTSPVYWAPVSGSCPAGQSGTITWEVAQTRTRSVSFICPAGTTTLPTETYGPWSPYVDAGATRNLVSNCTTMSCGPAPANGARSIACPAGQVGSTQQAHTWSSAPKPTCWVATPWSTVSSTCAPQCVAPAPSSVAISRAAPNQGEFIACEQGFEGQSYQERTQVENGTQTTSYSCPAPSGSWTSMQSSTWSGNYTATGPWVITWTDCARPCYKCNEF